MRFILLQRVDRMANAYGVNIKLPLLDENLAYFTQLNHINLCKQNYLHGVDGGIRSFVSFRSLT
ncbi:MAG: hypothetical protein H8E13_18250 [Actinobacteria bacterium]|nr:hypothetical protein [Actinomycetota bacterium]